MTNCVGGVTAVQVAGLSAMLALPVAGPRPRTGLASCDRRKPLAAHLDDGADDADLCPAQGHIELSLLALVLDRERKEVARVAARRDPQRLGDLPLVAVE